MRHKVFCIGMNKTGTTTLHKALQILGFNSIHDSYKCDALITAAILGNYKLLHYLGEYNAFSDYPFFRYYRELDMQYPESKFILNTRSLEGWLKSRIAHDTSWNTSNPSKPQRVTEKKLLSNYFESVENEIQSYFKNRANDFLIFNIDAGDSWPELCRFLDVQIPKQTFPHANKT